ncbi:DUF6308 family protein [Brachybacterium sp.]|uniref:DUF6308 family protein n=1 Tax=Brachybacterium sp. TaxID=1891286 RepID=UPI002ED4ABB9
MTAALPDEFQTFRQHVLDTANEEQLLDYLKTYSEGGAYTGAYFHELTHTGPAHPDRFDISDVASLSLLSVTLNGQMAHELTKKDKESDELARVLGLEPDRDLGELTVDQVKTLNGDEGLNPAWKLVNRIQGVGPTRTSKLLARKRPRLIPIWDSVIARVLGLPTTSLYWIHFHTALTLDNSSLDKKLSELAEKAGVGERYSRIRVLDILAWMYGKDKKNYESTVLTELDAESDEE